MFMKSTITLAVIFLVLLTCARAQSLLPSVPKGSIKGCEIEGTYTPRGEFKEMFPRFPTDGLYRFNKADIIPSPMGLDYDGYFFLDVFDSNTFPAVAAVSSNSFSKFNRVIAQFTTSEPGVQFHLDRNNYISTNFEIKHPQTYQLSGDAVDSYDKMNIWYKTLMKGLLERKACKQVSASDLGTLEFNTDSLHYDDLVLEFQYVQSNTWMQPKTAGKFPSHSLYYLVVKNVSGQVISKYGQAIFFEGKHSKTSRPKLTEHFVFSTTFPVAAESLINRFLNDNAAQDTLTSANNNIRRNMDQNALYADLIKVKNQYELIKAKKAQLAIVCANTGVMLSEIEGSMEGVKKANEEQAILNTVAGNDVSGAVGGLVSSMIIKRSQNKEMSRVKQVQAIAEQSINKIRGEEDSLIGQISRLLVHPSDLDMILKDRKDMDNNLNAVLQSSLAQSQHLSGQLNDLYRGLNTMYLSNIQSGLQAVARSYTSESGPAATSQGESLADDCSKKSELEWKSSPEYGKCAGQTVVNANQASCERAKAKLIEITLKNCRSKLPANEIQMLEQTRQQLLQRAAQMDKQAFRMN